MMLEEIKNEIEDEIENEIKSVEYFIEKSPKTGEYTFALKKEGKKRYILSKYKPREFAIEQINDAWEKINKETIWILVGYGFGYMTEAILNKVGNNAKIIIIEPNQELLKEQMKLYPIRKEASSVYTLFTDKIELREQLESLIPMTEVNNISIYYLEHYLTIYKEFCTQLIQIFKEIKFSLESDFVSLIEEKNNSYLSTLKNIRYIEENCDMKALRKVCKNVPALIVCAGPSLQKGINEIKNFKGIIIAVGRTMTALFNHNIRPDFVVSLSLTDLVFETFGEYKKHDVPLVTSIESNAKVVENSKGIKYFMLNNGIVTNIFKTYVNPNTAYSTSVSTLCLSFAEFIGCNPITIIGQDLAFTDGKLYAEEAKTLDSTQATERLITKDWKGQPITSCETYIKIKNWMERQIQNYPDIIHINASEGGVYIDGMLHMPLYEVVKKYCDKEKPEITHVKLAESKTINYQKCINSTKDSLEKIQRYLKIKASSYRQLEIEYKKKSNINWKKVNQEYGQIHKVEEIIQHIPNSNNIINMLFEIVNMILKSNNENKPPINETHEEEKIRVTRICKEMNDYLAKECENFISLINEILTDN